MDIGKYLTQGWNLTLKNIGTMVAASIVALLLSCLTIGILAAPLVAGMFVMYLRAAAGKQVKFPELFSCMDKWVSLALVSLLIALLVAVGLALLVVPGLLLATWAMYTVPVMATRSLGFKEAFAESRHIVNKSGILMSFFLLAVVSVIIGVGGAAWGVGTIITLPIGLGTLAVAYKDLSK